MDDSIKSKLTDSTNAQESMHAVYYQIGERNSTREVGFTMLLLFVKELQLRYELALKGDSIRYGIPEYGRKCLRRQELHEEIRAKMLGERRTQLLNFSKLFQKNSSLSKNLMDRKKRRSS